MAQATLSVRLDKNDKKLFERFCEETGMNVSTAINMYVKNVIHNQKLPFEVAVQEVAVQDPFYNPDNLACLRRAIDELERTGGTLHELEEADE